MIWLLGLWERICALVKRRPRPLRAQRVEDLPDKLDSRNVYIVGEGEYIWFVAMLCPCGCGETLQMSALTGARPRWKVTEHTDSTVSLDPSVWRKVGCCSHFFLRRGLIQWCEDNAD